MKSEIEFTYKSNDTEEFLDKIFYRPVGYLFALASRLIGITPNTITTLSILVGVAAGHLFYYQDMTLNIYGMLLLILAEAMDSADGQLARMTNTKSRYGRILDGLGGNLWFVSIYLHLAFRLINTGASPWIFVMIILAGVSHSLQSAMADYYRNNFVLFTSGKSNSEIDKSSVMKELYNQLSWTKNFYRKTLMRIYVNYTVEQETFAKTLIKLSEAAKAKYGDHFPEWLSDNYDSLNRHLIKYFNILTTNTRMIVLFVSLFIGMPILYWVFELTALNLILIYVVFKQESNSKYLLSILNEG